MLKHHTPATIAPPFSRYSHAVEVAAGARWLHISGQIGVEPDGTVPEGAEAQLEQAWGNIFAILDAAGMTRHDLVKTTVFMTAPGDTALARRVRERMLDGATPASTLIFVAGLARPDFLIEIEAIAAAD